MREEASNPKPIPPITPNRIEFALAKPLLGPFDVLLPVEPPVKRRRINLFGVSDAK